MFVNIMISYLFSKNPYLRVFIQEQGSTSLVCTVYDKRCILNPNRILIQAHRWVNLVLSVNYSIMKSMLSESHCQHLIQHKHKQGFRAGCYMSYLTAIIK